MTQSTTGLVELNRRLRELVPVGHLTGSSDYQLVNPDGPEAATAIAELVAALVEAKRSMWIEARVNWTLADFKNWAVIQQIDAVLEKVDGKPRTQGTKSRSAPQ